MTDERERRRTSDRRAVHAITAAGRPERRHHERRQRERRRDEEDRQPWTVGDHQRYTRKATAAFVALTIISCIAAYLSYTAGQDSRDGLARSAARASFNTCVSGADLRVTNAKGLDDLRSLAIDPRRVPRAVALRFTRQTQPAIDTLLTQAAYGSTPAERRGREFHAPLPPGSVTLEVAARVHELALARCTSRAGSTFGTAAQTS